MLRHKKVQDYIHVEHIIPKNICDNVVNNIKNKEWSPHIWYNYKNDSYSSEETMELDVQDSTPELQKLLTPFVIKAGAAYNLKFADMENDRTRHIMIKLAKIRFNRYGAGQIMRAHHDHIHSLFDGKEKGIPVLSFIGNLNDDYEGAELVFWGDYVQPLKAGDIVMFPSCFMYPHEVREVTKGTRYSFVAWGW